MCFVTDGHAEAYQAVQRKARKNHRCDECRTAIERGATYTNHSGVFDGSWFRFKECAKCVALRQRIHDLEIASGCYEYEAWCPFEELKAAVDEGNYGLLTRDDDGTPINCDRLAHHLYPALSLKD